MAVLVVHLHQKLLESRMTTVGGKKKDLSFSYDGAPPRSGKLVFD